MFATTIRLPLRIVDGNPNPNSNRRQRGRSFELSDAH